MFPGKLLSLNREPIAPGHRDPPARYFNMTPQESPCVRFTSPCPQNSADPPIPHVPFSAGSVPGKCLAKRTNFVSDWSCMASNVTQEYREAIQRMTGAEKLRAASRLYWAARKLKAARLRQQHPDWSEEKVNQRVVRIFKHAAT
jgi:hypothetical protein